MEVAKRLRYPPRMKIRMFVLTAGLSGALVLGGCDERQTGPISVSAIGSPPKLRNPNLQPLDPPAELLLLSTAQGLVQLDAAGQIEPALAQSWIVSDDGLRYTFRLRRTNWHQGGKVTAQQVVARLKASVSPASRNPLKPLLGAIQEVVAMTDEVLEISLVSPRPNFLQLLAQPQMAIILGDVGTGPFHPLHASGVVALHAPPDESADEDSADEEADHEAPFTIRGERAALAVARFSDGGADLVVGGTAGDLPIARAARPGDALVFDPVAGLLGLSFSARDGIFRDPGARAALSMAVDRASLVAALGVPGLEARQALLPGGIDELPQPALPAWAANPLPNRRADAARTIAALNGAGPLTLRVAMPEGPGYKLIFAHLRRDWRAIGIDARQVPLNDRAADVRLIDQVAPVELASWYLRQFACEASAVCDPAADEMMAAARMAATAAERALMLGNADRILTETTPFIPIAAPVRWSLVSPRLSGFRPNQFGRHNIAELVAPAS